MGGSLAVRSMASVTGLQIHYVDLGDAPLEEPDPALALCTGALGKVAIIPAKTMCVSTCKPAEEPRPFGVIIESRALSQMAERAKIAMPVIDTRHKDGVEDAAMRGVLFALQTELTETGLASSLYIDALLAQLIVCVFRAFSGPLPILEPADVDLPGPPDDARLGRALRYIEEHLTATIGVEDIARAVELSPFHFSRAFKRWTGESPHRYLLNVRLERAHRMVVTSQTPLASIATAVGFYDQSHFGTHFKRRFGTTPRELRKNVRVR
jgi:AraC-like DNA-binding protein